jgi:thiamine-monophosphate kinase
LNEFEIIEHYFKQAFPASKGNLVLGIGDDAAILNVSEDTELVVSIDTLVAGVHFFEEDSPESIAYKSLGVNLSDIAAMGALPRWISLSITLPDENFEWIKKFSSGFNQSAIENSLVLIGGDLTKGPLSITVQIHGVAPKGKSIRRSGANVGDTIYVTGELGAAAYALRHIENSTQYPSPTKKELDRFNRPDARTKTGIALRGLATSCIDISDGLLADLGHILKASNVGAEVKLSDIPFSDSLYKLNKEAAIELALTGGDDYELCFTLPKGVQEKEINELASICPIHCIGTIKKEESKLRFIEQNGELYEMHFNAYRHFG